MHDCDWVLITKNLDPTKTIHRLSAVICVPFSKKKLHCMTFSSAFELRLI